MNIPRIAIRFLCVLFPAVAFADLAEVERIKERLRADLAEHIHIVRDDVERYLSGIGPDGSWAHITYDYRTGNPDRHLYWMYDMALFHHTHGDELEDDFHASLGQAVLAAYDYWLAKDLRSDNWWHNRIGIQNFIGPTMLLMEDHLTEEQKEAGLRVMERGGPPAMTGANLAWVAQNYIIRGLLIPNPEFLREGFARMAEEIYISDEEGIQQDFSFHQHGELPYAGGYGTVFSGTVARFAYLAEGTSYAFPSDRVDLLTGLVLDGMQWMVYGGRMDRSQTGRNISRGGDGGGFGTRVTSYLSRVENPRQEEIITFEQRLKGEEPEVSGNRHFWRSDYMVHRRPHYFVSVRMLSDRTIGTEGMNGENLKGYHLGKGNLWIQRESNEYAGDFLAAMDWRRLPGITTAQFPVPARWEENSGRLDWVKSHGRDGFVGGVSDGTYGAATMQFTSKRLTSKHHRYPEDLEDAQFRNSWFFFDDEFIALGAGIRYDGGEPVLTTVNQSNRQGPVHMRGARGVELLSGGATHRLDAPAWVVHDGAGYVFPGDGQPVIRVEAKEAQADWSRINLRGASHPQPVEIFTLALEHGTRPAGASYQYIVLPEATAEGLAHYAANPPVGIIANTPQVQAVRHEKLGLAQVVFHEPGEIEVGRWMLRVDEPCLVLAGGASGEVFVASPDYAGTITLEWTPRTQRRPGRGSARTMVVELPGGLDLGKSIFAGHLP